MSTTIQSFLDNVCGGLWDWRGLFYRSESDIRDWGFTWHMTQVMYKIRHCTMYYGTVLYAYLMVGWNPLHIKSPGWSDPQTFCGSPLPDLIEGDTTYSKSKHLSPQTFTALTTALLQYWQLDKVLFRQLCHVRKGLSDISLPQLNN